MIKGDAGFHFHFKILIIILHSYLLAGEGGWKTNTPFIDDNLALLFSYKYHLFFNYSERKMKMKILIYENISIFLKLFIPFSDTTLAQGCQINSKICCQAKSKILSNLSFHCQILKSKILKLKSGRMVLILVKYIKWKILLLFLIKYALSLSKAKVS